MNLKVITNNVYLDFDNLNESKNLKHKYSGTLYIWKINKEILENREITVDYIQEMCYHLVKSW